MGVAGFFIPIKRFFFSLFVAFLWSFFNLLPSCAGTFEVAPTTIRLAPHAPYGVFYITNRDHEPLVIQTEAIDWSQKNGGNHYQSPSAILMASPPIIKLMPGRKQTVRLLAKISSAQETPRAFRLLVSELPKRNHKQSGVQLLLQFSIPVFLENQTREPPNLTWKISKNKTKWKLTARNDSAKHLKLSQTTLNWPQGSLNLSRGAAFQYILPRGEYSWIFQASGISGGQKLTIKTIDEDAGKLVSSLLIP